MEFLGGNIYHVYNQGNNHQRIFFERKNYYYFMDKVKQHLLLHCNILAWCLMPNHFHWMIEIPEEYDQLALREKPKVKPLNRSISVLLSSYTKGINKAYDRSGSLFRMGTKAKPLIIDSDRHSNYPLTCFLYIHQNPLKAKLTDYPGGWEFSSYSEYCSESGKSICDVESARELLDLPSRSNEFRKFSHQTINPQVLKGIF